MTLIIYSTIVFFARPELYCKTTPACATNNFSLKCLEIVIKKTFLLHELMNSRFLFSQSCSAYV